MISGDPAEDDEANQGRSGGSDRGHSGDAARALDAVGGDLWSVPASLEPAGDLPAEPVLAPLWPTLDKAAQQAVQGPSAVWSGRLRRKSMSFATAVAVLIGLGLAAWLLDPSPGATPFPAAPSLPASGAAKVVTGGPPYCPMRTSTAVGLNCFFIG